MKSRLAVPTLALVAVLLAACGEETYETQPTNQPSGPVTGVLLNLQMPNTEDTELVAGQATKFWTVEDSAGNVLFRKADIQGAKGEFYSARRSEVTTKSLWLGKNYREFPIVNFEMKQGGTESEPERTFKFIVSDSVAAEMRGIPNLMQLIQNADLVILTGRSGQ